MLASKVTNKYQATIPSNIRKFLRIDKGDKIEFEIKQNKVLLRKVTKNKDYEYLKSLSALLAEWSTPEDDEAYRDL